MTSRTKRTAKSIRAAFLSALEGSGNVTWACAAAKVARRTAYDWREADEAFAAAWDAALELGLDGMEDEATRRAVDGVDEPVFYQGEVCGMVRRYSDGLLMFLLKARRPDTFREQQDLNVNVTHTLVDRLDAATKRIEDGRGKIKLVSG